MLAAFPFLTYVAWTLTSPTSVGANCTISIRYPHGDLHEPQPLILKRNNGYTSFLYPEYDDRILRIRTGDTIYLACPGKGNYLNDEFWGNEAEAVCVWDKSFHVKGGLYDFSTLVCAKSSTDSTRSSTTQTDICKHTTVEIGFNVGDTFVRTIEICRDDWTYMTYFAKSQITKHIGGHQTSYPRPGFKEGVFYKGLSVNNLYKFNSQKEALAKILGSPELLEGRLKKSEQFLARGHMVAKADFVYGSQQKSTFWFVNVAPQWQTINDGNWRLLETSVRDLANKRRLELEVYTGVHGLMTMKDIHDVEQPIYLYPEGRALPVPKYFWKVVYDPLQKQGVALVGLNDPFVESITNNLKLCKDITKKITWLTWFPNNITAGISYACSVNELRKNIPEVPNLQVTRLLI